MKMFDNSQMFAWLIPEDLGSAQAGTRYGPEALATSGAFETLRLGKTSWLRADPPSGFSTNVTRAQKTKAASSLVRKIQRTLSQKTGDERILFVGGDHLITAGTLFSSINQAELLNRPLYVIWIDAHPDFNTPQTSYTGNLHGMPLAYLCGLPGFQNLFPQVNHPLSAERILMIGARAIDPKEGMLMERNGIAPSSNSLTELSVFLEKVSSNNGLLHISFDLDALDPTEAPGVTTPEPKGLKEQELAQMFCCIRETSPPWRVDVVEYNPLRDTEEFQTIEVLKRLVRLLF